MDDVAEATASSSATSSIVQYPMRDEYLFAVKIVEFHEVAVVIIVYTGILTASVLLTMDTLLIFFFRWSAFDMVFILERI